MICGFGVLLHSMDQERIDIMLGMRTSTGLDLKRIKMKSRERKLGDMLGCF
jgi:hypothetical protein